MWKKLFCLNIFSLQNQYNLICQNSICFSISPSGFIIADIPLFEDLRIYFPVSIALNILCTKCCLGPIDFPNHPSSEILIIKSKLEFFVKFPL